MREAKKEIKDHSNFPHHKMSPEWVFKKFWEDRLRLQIEWKKNEPRQMNIKFRLISVKDLSN